MISDQTAGDFVSSLPKASLAVLDLSGNSYKNRAPVIFARMNEGFSTKKCATHIIINGEGHDSRGEENAIKFANESYNGTAITIKRPSKGDMHSQEAHKVLGQYPAAQQQQPAAAAAP